MKNFSLFICSFLLLNICCFSQTRIFYKIEATELELINTKAQYSTFVEKYINDYLLLWKLKQIGENPKDWETRVNSKTISEKRETLNNTAEQIFANQARTEIHLHFKLGNYNVSKQYFLVDVFYEESKLGSIKLLVPETEKDLFLEKYDEKHFSYFFSVKDGSLEVKIDSYRNDIAHFRVEKMASFPGGMDGLQKFIVENLEYPQIAVDTGIKGIVVVNFVVDKNGNVRNPKITKSVHPLLDEAAINVVNKMPSFEPGEQGGEKVPVYFNLPIQFK